MKYLIRQNYLDKIIRLQNTPDIKVITGMRRSGKSILLKEFMDYIIKNDSNANIVFINFQDIEFEELLEYHNLHKYALDNFKEGMYNLLIIDEVQLCKKFELAINSLHSKNIFDIYITGSNAFLLSSDLATLFTGRTMSIEVFPFSFKEYLDYYNSNDDIDLMFNAYLKEGGMPGSLVYEDIVNKYNYLSDVFNTVLLRDLINKYKIRNQNEIKKLSEYMMDNIGNILSPNNICNCLNNDKVNITRKTISKYLNYFENSFMFYKAKRYDIVGKKYLSNSDKYYLSDVGFRYAINGTRNLDYGRCLENIVYLELLRRSYEVYVGKLYTKEIDFVAIKQNEKIYIQVSEFIDNEKTFEREYVPLLSIKDAYPKMIIARTKIDTYDYNGILIVDIAKWLLKK
ncbi:predicted ATPase (AAA+ superfamily) [Firmicutes bacterium CAG:449]|nr:predicted ATPase (AAA+ superfamily) [Firmicutes bacterium CAG:449]